jgi:hypothetical protein
MSITKYKASAHHTRIEPVQVEKETTAAIWFKDWTFAGGPGSGELRRHLKRTSYENYFDTWDEAKAFLFAEAEAAVFNARRQLERANAHLGNVKGLRQPEAA